MQSRVFRRAGTCVLISAVAGSILLGAPPAAQAVKDPVRAAEAIGRYDTQQLTWKPCLDKAELPGLPAVYYRLECATMLAPRDWNVPQAGADLRIKVSRLKSVKAKNPAMLFTNPGGPGAEGAEFPFLLVSANRKKLLSTQDVYGMDVRGTGGSSNLTCGGVSDLTVDPRVRTEANIGLMLDAAELTAKACEVAGGDLRKYVTTAQTVQDVDLLRRLAGQEKVNWLGFSSGTWLGAHYATAFPQRAGRMVFDSNVEFTSTWQEAFNRQPLGFQRRFESDFATWMAKYHSVYGLGTTKKAVLASYEKLRSQMTPDAPVEDAATLDDIVASTLYAKVMFPDAAAVLMDLKNYVRAQSSGKFRTADKLAYKVRQRVTAIRRTGMRRTFSGDAASTTFLAVTCQDTAWTSGRDALVTASAEAGAKNPLIGWSTISQPCAFWKRPEEAKLPVPNGKDLPPVLMVQSEHDPATPIEGAQAAAAGFAGARLLTVKGEGDHGIYAGGNACVDKKVEKFLTTGKLPAAGATCKGTAAPKPGYGLSQASVLTGRTTNPLLAWRRIRELLSS
ncbi:alpha/beta hydrolase [Kineosporia babensis]|uniref:Alpha/beta hydrolase n=1 Tax=Kineosporia babensis TaxID=499548 RepID=A0A9X1SRR7_9ACTN|nr:alpha/beta hydrolase [Kineosporia babensis]MCD5309912.1 alpha/beta hydrolase [Kineosporia babensis]